MRKRLQLLLILFISLFYRSQDNSLAAFVNTPVAYQTGVPDISFPLVSLPATKDLTLNFGLAYNVNAYKGGDYSGIIGRNWMLTGSNYTIKRQVMSNLPDEIVTMNLEPFDDIYYYNLNGEQGSFRFERTGIYPNDTYKIIKLTPSNIIIESERIQISSTVTPRWLKSFTIKDSKGYKYYFTDYDQNMTMYDSPSGSQYPEYQRNEFYITRIEDPMGKTIASFTNTKYIKYKDNSNNTIIESFYFLPEQIQTAYGSISFAHGDSNNDILMNVFPLQDRRYIKSVTLRDHKGNFVLKNDLTTFSSSYYEPKHFTDVYYRALSRIESVDKNNNLIDRIDFSYKSYSILNNYGFIYGSGYTYDDDSVGEQSTTLDLLNAIQFSSGKKIEYQYKFNKTLSTIDFNSPENLNLIQGSTAFVTGINFLRDVVDINIDTNITKKYYLPVSSFKHGPKTRLYVEFDRTDYYSNDTGNPPMVTGESNIGENSFRFDYIVVDPVTGEKTNPINIDGRNVYVITPGHNVYLEVLGSGGKGFFHIREKDYNPSPYSNMVENGNPVIDSVNYYMINSSNYNTYELNKTIKYDYELFDGSGLSSGVPETNYEQERIIYKNLKITESDKPGYTKYYFKTQEDYAGYYLNDQEYVWPNYNLIKNGLLEKKEVYNDNNLKHQETQYDYIFPPYNTAQQYLIWYASMGNFQFYTSESFFDKIRTTDISYDNSGNTLTGISEKTFNQSNNNLMSEKKTSADGTVSETIYQYAAEKNNTRLLGANMFSIPLEVIQKQNDIQVGKLETKYEQTGNYFPSSVQSFGINNVINGEQINNHYDAMGNVLQTTNKAGIPTAIIWGYNGTQPIAKIEGAKYADVLYLLGLNMSSDLNILLDIVKKSNQDISSTDNTNEQLLRDALEVFRKKPEFKNFLITTYTYDPLIGVKSVTSPNGFTEYYYYDNANRLQRIEDQDHKVLKEYKYKTNYYPFLQ